MIGLLDGGGFGGFGSGDGGGGQMREDDALAGAEGGVVAGEFAGTEYFLQVSQGALAQK